MGQRLTKRQQERRKKKLAEKAARRAQYEKWRDEGRVKGSARARRNASRAKRVRTLRHRAGPCGNIGCQKCSALLRRLGGRGGA